MFVTTLSPAILIQTLATPREEDLVERLDEEFGIRLRDVPYGVNEEFFVKIHDSSVEIAEGFSPDPSVTIELGFADFLSILFGGLSVSRLVLTGKMKVKPFWKLCKVLAFLSMIRLKGSWYFPLSDFI
jgi:hypothetical protein